jgi:pentatricopeptide repeat protein
VICYNLLIDAFGQKFLYKEAESTYLQLHEARCIPNEDTYALLIKAYCLSGKLQNAEAVFAEMRNYGLPSSMFLNQLVFLSVGIKLCTLGLQNSHTLHINHLRYIYKYDMI